jgi:hypothetical protein
MGRRSKVGGEETSDLMAGMIDTRHHRVGMADMVR